MKTTVNEVLHLLMS